MCELATGDRGVRRRCRRRGADDRRPSRCRARRSGDHRARRHRDRAAPRQLRARARSGRRVGRTSPRHVPARHGRGDQPGAPARARRAAVRGADPGRRPPSDAPAVQLFVERARAVAPGFDPDPGELAVVAEIVRRLDGLPLAIELAAARLHTLDVAEVAAGLDHRFTLLSSGLPHVRPPRLAQRGDVVVVRAARRIACSGPSPTCRSSPGRSRRSTRPRSAASTGDGHGRPPPARRALARDAGARPALRPAGDAAGVRRRAARRRRTGRCRGRAPRPPPGRVDRGRRSAAARSRRTTATSPRSTPRCRSCAPRSSWLLDHDGPELAGRLVVALLDYGLLRLRPDVLAWAERVTAADPDDRSPVGAGRVGGQRLRGVDGRRRGRGRRPRRPGAREVVRAGRR